MATTKTQPKAAIRMLTEEDYEPADNALGRFHHELETLKFKIRAIKAAIHSAGDIPLAETPTYEDMGRLCAFVLGVRMTLEEIDENVAILERALDDLDHARLTGTEAA